MEEKITYNSQKNNFSKGSVIILQGDNEKAIYFLNKGSLELKRCSVSDRYSKNDDLLKNSKRIGVIDAPSIFGIQNIFDSSNHENSFLALSDCEVTKYVVNANNFLNFFKANPPIALNVLLTMEDQARMRYVNLKKYIDFIAIISKFSDNLHLLYLFIQQAKGDAIYKKFIHGGGSFPGIIDSGFLMNDHSEALGKKYGAPDYNPKTIFEWDKLEFFRSLLKTKSGSFVNLLSSEIKIFMYMFENLTAIIKQINIEVEKFARETESILNHFFLDGHSPFNQIYSVIGKIRNSDKIDRSVTASIVKICRNLDHINKQLGGREYIEVFPKYDAISNSAALGKSTVTAHSNNTAEKATPFTVNPQQPGQIIETAANSTGQYKQMYKDSITKILNFSTLDKDTKEQIAHNILMINKIDLEDAYSKKTRTAIKKLQDDYFLLYENLFFKTIKSAGEIPPAVRLFLYFSFIDERLISESQMEFLHSSLNIFSQTAHTEYPIITLYDYLKLIYNMEEEPSLSEKGEFRKIIKKPFSKSDRVFEDTPKDRLSFEIENMVSIVMRITSDSMRAYIPYLTEKAFKGSFNQILTTPKKIDGLIKKIVAIDHTLFFRELTWKIPGKSELIQKEIKPYFILIPNAGQRIQMWQEMSYNLRSTRGRFLVPILFSSDLEKCLIQSCGHFRWNMNKAIVTNWMDPVEGGLTGAYFDYEQTYKKNPELSSEIKDKIKEQIKSIKIDRDRFAYDYFEWINYESQGIPKLNKILRKIFYRLIPFNKEIRANNSKLPVYTELDRKYNIILDREFKRWEAKFKKYKEEAGQIPEDLQAFLEMLQH